MPGFLQYPLGPQRQMASASDQAWIIPFHPCTPASLHQTAPMGQVPCNTLQHSPQNKPLTTC